MSKKNHYSKLYLLFAPLRSLVKLIWQIFILFALSSFFGKDRDYLSKPHFWLYIPRSTNVIKYEQYVNENFEMPTEQMDHFEEWTKTPEAQKLVDAILRENHIA